MAEQVSESSPLSTWEGSPLLPQGHKDAFGKYMSTCKEHGTMLCGDALIRLELGCTRLSVKPDFGKQFTNLDLHALVNLLESEDGKMMEGLKVLDFSDGKLTPGGIFKVAELLKHPKCTVEELDLSNQDVQAEGARALVLGIHACPSLSTLRMHTSNLRSSGAKVFVDYLFQDEEKSHRLKKLDLQNNFISYSQCHKLWAKAEGIDIDLQGNRVRDEVMNAVTHGMGAVAAIVGTVFMARACVGKPTYYTVAVVPYCASLVTLFLSSCLFHSFHALGKTVYTLFCWLDHSAIFVLIAGSYTPFLAILFHGMWYETAFLIMIWSIAAFGIGFTIIYEGPYKQDLENVLYLVMGWCIVLVCRDLYYHFSTGGIFLLVLGGLLYSIGVVFFVRDSSVGGFPDHTIWHLFVLSAALSHYLCIYWYVVVPYPGFHVYGPP